MMISGVISATVLSAEEFMRHFLKKLNVSYLLGGSLGYIPTKLIFVDLAIDSLVTLIAKAFLYISFLWSLKRCFFVKISYIFHCLQKIFDVFRPSKSRSIENVFDNEEVEARVIRPSFEDQSLEFIDIGQFNGPNEEDSFDQRSRIESVMIAGSSGTRSLPSVDLLDKHQSDQKYVSDDEMSAVISELMGVLKEFGVRGEIVNVRQGPVVTMFEFRPLPGIKTSRVVSLSDDISRSMSALSARIATIPGHNAIGIELPNRSIQTVFLRELLSSDVFCNFSKGIPIVLGKDINGIPVVADLTKMPHLLIAGTTGSGKSVSVNAMILSILFKFTSDMCKLIMIDPKMLELSVYSDIPHLLTPVVTEPKKAVFALKWAVSEMENRYRKMSKLGVRNIDGFNQKIQESREKADLLVRRVQVGFDQDTGRPIFETQHLDFEFMPYIVVIVDEMADLMLVAGKDIEFAVQRLAQMARAAGIHLIMATQRPSVDVITGTIKANFPTRISFQVTSKIDSRTILGEQGAEQLLGHGDMLYMQGGSRPIRVHGPLVKDFEVERIVEFVKLHGAPMYVDIVSESQDSTLGTDVSDSDDKELFNQAVDIVMSERKVSISYIQRKLKIGYNRAARIVEEMEERGIVSPPNHKGKREIL
jgi:S-DNA-T family DNA segregation ATPase FtsK/SpoIIIE